MINGYLVQNRIKYLIPVASATMPFFNTKNLSDEELEEFVHSLMALRVRNKSLEQYCPRVLIL